MEEKERVLDQHSRQKDIIQSNIESLDNDIETHYSELCSRCFDGNEFALLKDYLEHLRHLKLEALVQKELIENKIALIRTELYDMLKEIKTLDTLKERALFTARRTQSKRHQKLLDDIALRLESRKT